MIIIIFFFFFHFGQQLDGMGEWGDDPYADAADAAPAASAPAAAPSRKRTAESSDLDGSSRPTKKRAASQPSDEPERLRLDFPLRAPVNLTSELKKVCIDKEKEEEEKEEE